jgi:hypothetical protein
MPQTRESAGNLPDQPIGLSGRIALWFGIAAVLAFVSSILFRTLTMPLGVRLIVTLLPAPALIALVLAARKLAHRMDELEQRVQLEALAWAFAVAGIAFLVFSQLQVADMLGPEDWVFPWITIWASYHLGVMSARRRYE